MPELVGQRSSEKGARLAYSIDSYIMRLEYEGGCRKLMYYPIVFAAKVEVGAESHQS